MQNYQPINLFDELYILTEEVRRGAVELECIEAQFDALYHLRKQATKELKEKDKKLKTLLYKTRRPGEPFG